MHYKVCVFDSIPQMDELPVAKIVNFDGSDNINDHIYAQGRVCYVRDVGMVVRIWAFEAIPMCDSSQITFCLKGDKADLVLAFSYSGVVQCFISGEVVAPPTVTYFESEDLQGEYWGGQFLLDNIFLEKYVFSTVPLEVGDSVKANMITFIKTKGSLFKEDFGEFALVN